jgi:hypothetical protein
MIRRLFFIAALIFGAAGLGQTPASAAPVSQGQALAQTAAAPVETVQWRHGYRRHRYWGPRYHYRRHFYRPYGYYRPHRYYRRHWGYHRPWGYGRHYRW